MVGVLANGSSEIHLGPWSAPADAALDPSLFEFAVAIKKLISVTAAQDTWWRFEYTWWVSSTAVLQPQLYGSRRAVVASSASYSACH